MSEEKTIEYKNSELENFLGLLPLGVDAKHEFKPEFYKDFPEKLKATFFISPLNNADKREWTARYICIHREAVTAFNGGEDNARYNDEDEYCLRELIRKNLKGWDSFKNSKEELIPFEVDSDGFLNPVWLYRAHL